MFRFSSATWIDNGRSPANPNTTSLPIKDTPELTANSLILPGNGWRTETGNITEVGFAGKYWLSTPLSSTNGYYLLFFLNNVDIHSVPYAAGQSIRCVRL